MTTAQLSQYLETAVDLEKAVFLQARRLAQYKEEIQALDRAARRPAPAPPEAAPVAPAAQTAHGASAGDFGQDSAGVPPFPRRRNRNQRPHLWPCQGVDDWGNRRRPFGLYSCHCRIFKSRSGQLLPVAHLPPFDGELPAHPRHLRPAPGKSPRQSWRPGKRPTPTFCAGTRSGSPRPSSGSRPWRTPSPSSPSSWPTARPLGPPTMPKASCSPNTGPLSWSAPCASWCSPAAALPWKGPKVPTSSWRPSSRRGGSSPTGTKSSARGTVCRPGSSSSALPCSRPRALPVRPFPASQVGGFLFPKLPLYGGNTPAETDKIVAFP